MDRQLLRAVEGAVANATGLDATVVQATPVAGGSINSARLLALSDGRRVFVKSNRVPLPGLFEREAGGLRALATALAEGSRLRVPKPIVHGEDPVPFLVIEAVDVGSPARGFFEHFGRDFAQFHQRATADRFRFRRRQLHRIDQPAQRLVRIMDRVLAPTSPRPSVAVGRNKGTLRRRASTPGRSADGSAGCLPRRGDRAAVSAARRSVERQLSGRHPQPPRAY